MMAVTSPFGHREGRAGTWEVCDSMRTILDSIPSELAAETVAREMNRAFQRGYRAAQQDICDALGVRSI